MKYLNAHAMFPLEGLPRFSGVSRLEMEKLVHLMTTRDKINFISLFSSTSLEAVSDLLRVKVMAYAKTS
jgi:hypothetical protein